MCSTGDQAAQQLAHVLIQLSCDAQHSDLSLAPFLAGLRRLTADWPLILQPHVTLLAYLTIAAGTHHAQCFTTMLATVSRTLVTMSNPFVAMHEIYERLWHQVELQANVNTPVKSDHTVLCLLGDKVHLWCVCNAAAAVLCCAHRMHSARMLLITPWTHA